MALFAIYDGHIGPKLEPQILFADFFLCHCEISSAE